MKTDKVDSFFQGLLTFKKESICSWKVYTRLFNLFTWPICVYGAVFYYQFLPTRWAKWPPPHFAGVTHLKRCFGSNWTCLPGHAVSEISPWRIRLSQFCFFEHVEYTFRNFLMYDYTKSVYTVFLKGPIYVTLSFEHFLSINEFYVDIWL